MVEGINIKKGFQQTEVGIIPNDWIVQKIGDLARVQRGASPRPIDSPIWFDMNSDIGWLRISDVSKAKKYLYTTTQNLSPRGIANSRFVQANKLVMSICATVGKPILTRKDVCIHDGFVVFNNLNADPEYLYYILKDIEPKWSRFGQTGSQMNLNTGLINKTKIPLPPTKAEQTAIAAALSDMDALIEGLEKLLEKKRNIKKGAMQELLRPKEGWKIKKFREISYMKGRIGWQGLKQTEFTMNPEHPFLITGMNFNDGSIKWDEVYHVPEERYEIAKDIQLRPGDVLMTKDGTIGKLLYVSEIPYPYRATLNSHLLVFRPIKNSYIPKFLYYQLDSNTFKDFIELRKTGTTFFGISQEAVGDYQVFLPNLEEQTFIANTLSVIDEEIEKLSTLLSKYKMLKTGMMQTLLTGKIRLI